MSRLAVVSSIALIPLACATLPACGQQSETQRILAQCSDPPQDQIDSCLEQARVQEETDPSPEMQKLIANLINRQVEARNQPRDLTPQPMSSDGSDPNGYDASPTPPPSPDLDGSGTYDAPPQDAAPPTVRDDATDAGQDSASQPQPNGGAPNPPP